MTIRMSLVYSEFHQAYLVGLLDGTLLLKEPVTIRFYTVQYKIPGPIFDRLIERLE